MTEFWNLVDRGQNPDPFIRNLMEGDKLTVLGSVFTMPRTHGDYLWMIGRYDSSKVLFLFCGNEIQDMSDDDFGSGPLAAVLLV